MDCFCSIWNPSVKGWKSIIIDIILKVSSFHNIFYKTKHKPLVICLDSSDYKFFT